MANVPPTTFALPGPGAGRRHAAAQGQPEGLVLRIDGVDGAQLRRQRLDDLIIIHALPAHALVVEADMAVRLDAAGREQAALRIESLNALRRVDRLADGGDFPVFEEQAAVFQVRARPWS